MAEDRPRPIVVAPTKAPPIDIAAVCARLAEEEGLAFAADHAAAMERDRKLQAERERQAAAEAEADRHRLEVHRRTLEALADLRRLAEREGREVTAAEFEAVTQAIRGTG